MHAAAPLQLLLASYGVVAFPWPPSVQCATTPDSRVQQCEFGVGGHETRALHAGRDRRDDAATAAAGAAWKRIGDGHALACRLNCSIHRLVQQ
jgi:hypothetical protein